MAKQGWGSRSPAGGSATSPRPGLPPTQEEGVRGPRQLVHLDSAPLGAGSPALGARACPSGCREPVSFSPTVRRGSPRGAAPGAAGLRVRRRLDRGGGGRGPGRKQSGAGELGLYRPASRAAADPRGPGFSTIVSGRSAGGRSGEGCRAPAPPPPAGAIPRRLWGGWGTARLIAKPRALSAAAGTAAPLLHRRRGLNSDFLLIPRLLAGVSYRSVEGSSSHAPSSRQVDRGVRYHLPLQGSGNYCPRTGAAGAGAEK